MMLDAQSFDPLGRWEVERGPQQLAYDGWWHLGYDTMVTSEWGLPATFENGLVPDLLLGEKYGRKLHFWDFTKRKHIQEIDFGEEYQLVFELRPAHDPTKAYGFVNCVISLKDLSSSIWTWYRDGDKWAAKKVIEIPAEPRRRRFASALAKGLQRDPAARFRHRSVDGRPLPLRVVLVHGLSAAIRRLRSVRAEARGQGTHRRRRIACDAAGRRERRAERRPADGRSEPRRQARVLHEFAIRCGGCAVLSRRHRRMEVKLDADPNGGLSIDKDFFIDWPKGHRPHQICLQGGDCSSDSLLRYP